MLLLLKPAVSHAACADTFTGCPSVRANDGHFVGQIISGVAGIRADGVTSDDVVLHNAAEACAAIGGTIRLPPGNILLTGASFMYLRNCKLEGGGGPAVAGLANSGGTTFLLTATGVTEFVLGNGARIDGINIYYPNQTTGTTVYAPTFADDGVHNLNHATFSNITCVNCYDMFVQNTGISWGDIKWDNITFFQLHDAWRMGTTGDGIVFTNIKASAGPWFNITGLSPNPGVVAASALNRTFHFTAGGGINMAISSCELSGRYGVLMDSGSLISQSSFSCDWDGTGTIIDSSAGGRWFSGNYFTGTNAGCYIPFNVSLGNLPCFKLGSQGELALNGFQSGGSQGDFITTAGASVSMVGTKSANIGSAADGGEYYQVHVTGGSPDIVMKSNSLSGLSCSNVPAGCHHVHGITTSTNVANSLSIQDNIFEFLQDDISIHTASSYTVLTGNVGAHTGGTASVTITGTDGVMYGVNNWDKPPAATPLSCGSGCTVSGGSLRGTISMGTGTSTSNTITVPFVPAPAFNTGATVCFANVANTAVRAACSLSGTTITISSSATIDSTAVSYDVLPPQ